MNQIVTDDEKKPIDGEQNSPEEVIVTIGDKEPDAPKEDSSTIKHMREQLKKQSRKIKELESNQVTDKTVELGAKPTLEGSGHDEEVYSKELIAWNNRKISIDSKAAEETAAKEKQDADWQSQMDAHREKVTALGAPDYEDAEDVVKGTFSEIQQALIVDASLDSAVVVYALGNNPEEAKKLAGIKNHAKFTAALARLESKVKVKKNKVAPPPEKVPEGTGHGSGFGDTKLEQLRAEAEKSGDISKVHAYRKQMKAAGK